MRSPARETCSPRPAARRPSGASSVHAWTIFLHTDRPDEHQDCVTRNAFGDRYPSDLCPANPDARAYARALVADVARYDVASIIAESLHYHVLEHGYHHERYFIELGAKARYLLGLCFCEHCLDARASRRRRRRPRAAGRARRARAACSTGEAAVTAGEVERGPARGRCRRRAHRATSRAGGDGDVAGRGGRGRGGRRQALRLHGPERRGEGLRDRAPDGRPGGRDLRGGSASTSTHSRRCDPGLRRDGVRRRRRPRAARPRGLREP